jgi:hypothetical protein
VRVRAWAESLATTASARCCSVSLSARRCVISASTGASPAMPEYNESRSGAGPVGGRSSGTESGSQGPWSPRTWPRTQDQAASPTSR